MLRVWQKRLLNNLLPANVLEFTTAGTQQIYIPQSRYYDIDLVGGGGAGTAIHRQLKSDPRIYAHWAFGGGSSGHTKINRVYIKQGYITITVGRGGTGYVQTLASTAQVGIYGGEDGGETSIIIDNTRYSVEGGKAGYLRIRDGTANDTARDGLAGTGSVSNGNKGQTIINATTQTASGGASVFENKGTGASAKSTSSTDFANNGGNGFIRLTPVL